MSQIIDPSYNARMNTEKEKFGVVFHAPELPAPSSVYANYVCFLSTDGCFYECHLDGETYVWEKQTFGPKRQFIISVTWLVQGSDGYSFNDEVDTIKQIVTEMKKYDSYFESLEAEYPTLETSTMNLLEACSITDKLIDYVNKHCYANLSNIAIDTDGMSTSDYVNPPAATCEQLATYLNEVIGVLNPHAGFSVLTKEVEAIREIISGAEPTYVELSKDEILNLFIESSDVDLDLNKVYFIRDPIPGSVVFRLFGGEHGDFVLWEFIGKSDLFVKEGDAYVNADVLNQGIMYPDKKYYILQSEVSVVTPADFNILRNTFNQFTSDQQVANRKFSEAITNIRSSITTINSTLGASGLGGTVDKIINTYLGINQAQWTSETKSIVTRITAIANSLTDATIEGSVAKSIKTLSTIVSGENGNAGLAKDVTDLKAAVTAQGTGLVDIVGSASKGLIKKVNEIATKVEELDNNNGSAKIQSIENRLELARTAFSEMSQILSTAHGSYVKSSDTSPIKGKRYWTRSVEYTEVVNPNLDDGNEYYVDNDGEMELVEEDPTLPGIDFHCFRADYTYTIARNVYTSGFEEGEEYYEVNMTPDVMVDAIWSIIEKSADAAAALEPIVAEEESESENEGD